MSIQMSFKNFLSLQETFDYQADVAPVATPGPAHQFKFTIGNAEYIINVGFFVPLDNTMYNKIFTGKSVMLFSFGIKEGDNVSYSKTETKDNFKVLATATNFMIQQANAKQPDIILYHASYDLPKVLKPSKDTVEQFQSRVSLYTKIASRFASKQGYTPYVLNLRKNTVAFVMSKEGIQQAQLHDIQDKLTNPENAY